MKLMRLAMWVAIFAVIGGTAFSGDMDIQALQAKLAAQEARLNDLQAKMNSKGSASEATGVVSIRKNAVVTIGGVINTRYFYHNAKFTAGANNEREYLPTGGIAGTDEAFINTLPSQKMSASDLKVSDAKLIFKMDVNDYFDGYMELSLGNSERTGGRWASSPSANDSVGIVQRAWVRWKNVCNTGFGLLVGRNDLVFGAADPAGMIEQGWNHNNVWWGDRYTEMGLAQWVQNPGLWSDTMNRIATDYSRVTQITPYWEGWNKKLKVELSLFQDWNVFDGGRSWSQDQWTSQNYGSGVSGRVRVTPIEGLNIYASAINRFSSWGNGNYPNNRAPNGFYGVPGNHHETGTNIAFDWTPCFFPRLKVFSGWTHTWNSGYDNGVNSLWPAAAIPYGTAEAVDYAGVGFSRVTSDVVHGGLLFNITEQAKFVVQGDWMRSKQSNNIGKIEGWAIYPAMRYTLPYGVALEVGYRYDYLKEKVSGDKFKVHTVYGHLGFNF